MQVKDNVNVSNYLQGGSQLGTANNMLNAGKSKEELNFSNFLTLAGNSEGLSEVADNKNISKSQRDEVSAVAASAKADKTDNSREVKKDTVENNVSNDSEIVTEKKDSVVSEDVSDEEQEAVIETINQILQMLMNQFQLSADELTAKLDEFGMDAASLLTGEGIREFFLYMESADVSDLLVNEELNLKLQEFMDEFNQIIEQMECTKENLNFVCSDLELNSLLENPQLQETKVEMNFISSEKLSDDSENLDEVANEPEVIVSKAEVAKNAEKQTGEQDEESSFSTHQQEIESTEKTVTNKESNFENPILQALDNAVNQTQENMAVANNGTVSGSDIIKQIVEQVRLNMNQDSTSMELQLNPEHLGKVQINVVSKEGVMTARILVETEAAKQAVEGGLTSLKETMEQQNLKVDAIEVMVSTTGFEGQDGQQDSYKKENETKSRKKLNLAELEEDVSQGDEVETLKMEASGSSVSYMA